jgi:hypothetical protein
MNQTLKEFLVLRNQRRMALEPLVVPIHFLLYFLAIEKFLKLKK